MADSSIGRKLVQIIAAPVTNTVLALADDGTLWFSHVQLSFDGSLVHLQRIEWQPVEHKFI